MYYDVGITQNGNNTPYRYLEKTSNRHFGTHVPHKFYDHKYLMQYICIKDKNGKEIYEGDLVKDGNGNIGKVGFKTACIWGCGCCCFKGFIGSGFVVEDNEGCFIEMDDACEAIGNIYENPELLGF